MLQRKQSLYLFVVFILVGLMVFFPLVEFQASEYNFTMNLFYFVGAGDLGGLPNPSVIGILTALLGVVSLGTIFQFSNRKLQMKLNGLSLLLNFGILLSIFFITDKVAAMEEVGDKPQYLVAAFFPVASVLFIVLANRSIRKDEALVKQSERIR